MSFVPQTILFLAMRAALPAFLLCVLLAPARATDSTDVCNCQHGSVNWNELLAMSITTALMAIGGVNVYRNRREANLWGTPPQQPPRDGPQFPSGT